MSKPGTEGTAPAQGPDGAGAAQGPSAAPPGPSPASEPPPGTASASEPQPGTASASEPPPGTPPDQPKPHVSTADKIKFGGLVVFFLLIIALSVLVVRYIGTLGTESVATELERAIREAGIFGILICLGVQFLQVVVAFIPGEVVQVAIGYVYGTVGGGLITLAGALVSSVFVFYLVRRLGAPFVQAMVGNKDSGRMRFLHNSKNLNSLVFILYLIPGLPKDLITYAVPLTEIRPREFFVLSTLARAPAIFASTFVAAAFKNGDFVGMIVVAAIFGGLGILGIVFNQKIMAFVDKVTARPSRHHKDGAGNGDEVKHGDKTGDAVTPETPREPREP
ncbi:MAG: TVP38/TMEM64 family protein [Coriobacteriales bacterium]|jgi:uncharacterized membrane protein YdjX (TVP38/TMEM64 family)|nr:TVP38/TMEM64 family protein [Coriobacteriales bacterium]